MDFTVSVQRSLRFSLNRLVRRVAATATSSLILASLWACNSSSHSSSHPGTHVQKVLGDATRDVLLRCIEEDIAVGRTCCVAVFNARWWVVEAFLLFLGHPLEAVPDGLVEVPVLQRFTSYRLHQ